MKITDAFVVCQVFNDGSGLTAPISQFPSLDAAANWLLRIFTRDGETEPLPQYDPELYCIEKWEGGDHLETWWVDRDGTRNRI